VDDPGFCRSGDCGLPHAARLRELLRRPLRRPLPPTLVRGLRPASRQHCGSASLTIVSNPRIGRPPALRYASSSVARYAECSHPPKVCACSARSMNATEIRGLRLGDRSSNRVLRWRCIPGPPRWISIRDPATPVIANKPQSQTRPSKLKQRREQGGPPSTSSHCYCFSEGKSREMRRRAARAIPCHVARVGSLAGRVSSCSPGSRSSDP
jgi:hypothetical protein